MEKSKVAVVACPDYEPARVKESLQKGLEAIGGLESLIGKEENILLKPNLVRSAKRERAVVTDPEVMDALITILQENGYENISCGDSCGLGIPEGIAKEAGLKEVLEKHNVPLKDFLTSERVETADGKFLMIAKNKPDFRQQGRQPLQISEQPHLPYRKKHIFRAWNRHRRQHSRGYLYFRYVRFPPQYHFL